jgi:hypothetical protein
MGGRDGPPKPPITLAHAPGDPGRGSICGASGGAATGPRGCAEPATISSMLSVEEALAQILSRVRPLGTERVDVLGSLGRVLAEPIVARRELPPWPNSSMEIGRAHV